MAADKLDQGLEPTNTTPSEGSLAERRSSDADFKDAPETGIATVDAYPENKRKKLSGFFAKHPFARAAPILGNELCERLAYYGIAINISMYLTTYLNLTNSEAASQVSTWSGTCYATPVLGALIADTFAGRYWTIFVFSVIYMVGMIGLACSAGVHSLHPHEGETPTSKQKSFFWAFMYLIAVGTGGIKPNVSTFGADQFNENDPKERKMIPSFYNWFYAFVNIGAVVSSTALVVIQTDVSWMVGFLIPAISFFFAISIFVAFTPVYHHKPPGGSPIVRWFRTIVGMIAHHNRKVPEDPSLLHEAEGRMSIVRGQQKLDLTPGLGWLNKAAVRAPEGKEDRWWLVTVTEVEEVKCVLRMLPVWLILCIYNSIYGQMSTLFVIQGAAMDRHLGSWAVPPAIVNALDCISVLFWVPVYDLVIAPYFERKGRPISRLTRMGVGFFIAILAMIAGAIVEHVRLQVVKRHDLYDVDPGDNSVNMSVWWQIPQYCLIGMSEVFAMIGGIEFFYSESPESMRSSAQAISLLATAVGNYLDTAYVDVVTSITTKGGKPGWIADNLNQGRVDLFFYMIAVIQAIGLIFYIWPICKYYRYRQLPFDEEELATSSGSDEEDASGGKPLAHKSGAPPPVARASVTGAPGLSRTSYMPVVHAFEINTLDGRHDTRDAAQPDYPKI